MNEAEQLELLTSEVERLDGKPASLGGLASQYSGRYIRERNPKLAALIALAAGKWGIPAVQIARETGVHQAAVAEIARESGRLSLEEDKKVLLHALRDLRMSAVNWMQQQFDAGTIKPAQLMQVAVMMGIVTEKHELLAGGPTQRVEVQADPELLAFQQMLLRTPQMVLPAESSSPKADSMLGAPLPSRLPSGRVLDVAPADNETTAGAV